MGSQAFAQNARKESLVKSPIRILAKSLWGRRAMNSSGVGVSVLISCDFVAKVIGILAFLVVRRRRLFKASQSIHHGRVTDA